MAEAYMQAEIQRLANLYPHAYPVSEQEKACMALHYAAEVQLKTLRKQWQIWAEELFIL